MVKRSIKWKNWGGIRAKLTLLAIAVVSLLYLFLGLTVFVVARQTILGSVDASLTKMAEGFAHPGRRPPPRDEFGPGRGPGPPPDGFGNGPNAFAGPPNHDPNPDLRDNLGEAHPQNQRGTRASNQPDPQPGDPPRDRPTVRPNDRPLEGQRNGVTNTPQDTPKGGPQEEPQNGPPGAFQGGPENQPGDRAASERDHTPREVDIHDGRPRLVYRSERLHTPFPFSKPVDPTGVTLAKSGISHLRTVQFDNEPVRVIDVPIYNPQHQVEGVVEMSYWLGDIYRVLATLAGTLILILPVGILLMGLASTYVVGKTLRPVREITGTAARMSAEDLSGRLPVSGNDEFAELAETMNGLLGRLETAFGKQKLALSQLQEVVEQQRKFTADASHELKTPLAIVKINASILKSSLEEHPDASESLDAIDEAVNRMSKLVQDLMLLARTDTGQLREQFEPVDLAESAQKAKSLVPCDGKIRLSGDKSVWLNGSRFALERLVVNLLENACRYTNQDGKVELSVHQEGSEAVLIVSDDGVGIPLEHLENIFKRFHRVDESRQSDTGGNGLGLAICKGIVEAHQGTISVSSSLGEGATFTVRIPIRHQDLSSQS